jgi:ribonuclease BN (tRNA processing enzyme)
VAQSVGDGSRRGRTIEDPLNGRLRLTVLGSSNAVPRPGRACSSYLVEGAGHAVVVDLGSGALGNLYRHRNAESIDAVVISHMHADHFLDVIPLRYALKYGPRTHGKKIALWLPEGGEQMLRSIAAAFAPESRSDFLSEVFDVATYGAADGLRLGEMRIRFAPTTHYIATFAVRCEAGSQSVTYSADTAPAESVVRLAHESDLFLCEATLRSGSADSTPRGHTSAREAGEMAQSAGVAKLLLTHYPAELSAEHLRAQASDAFAGEVAVVDDGERFTA